MSEDTYELKHLSPEIQEWLSSRREAGKQLVPETAEVMCIYGYTVDPYGVYSDLECQQVQRNYFARAPGSDIWVLFDDLPDATYEALWERIDRGEFDDSWKSDLPF